MQGCGLLVVVGGLRTEGFTQIGLRIQGLDVCPPVSPSLFATRRSARPVLALHVIAPDPPDRFASE